jgi:hypothetical protein
MPAPGRHRTQPVLPDESINPFGGVTSLGSRINLIQLKEKQTKSLIFLRVRGIPRKLGTRGEQVVSVLSA